MHTFNMRYYVEYDTFLQLKDILTVEMESPSNSALSNRPELAQEMKSILDSLTPHHHVPEPTVFRIGVNGMYFGS